MSCNESATKAEAVVADKQTTIEDIMAVNVEDYFCHYMEDIDLPGDFPIPDAVDIYNTSVIVQSLYSVDDFWRVFENNEDAMSTLHKVDLSVIKDKNIRSLAQEAIDKYKYFLEVMCQLISIHIRSSIKERLLLI